MAGRPFAAPTPHNSNRVQIPPFASQPRVDPKTVLRTRTCASELRKHYDPSASAHSGSAKKDGNCRTGVLPEPVDVPFAPLGTEALKATRPLS